MTTQEIFSQNQVLTVAKAKELKGKKIACTSPEYRANTPRVTIFIVGEIISAWDLSEQNIDERFGEFKNQQNYWKSYMSEKQIDEAKTTMVLLSENGGQFFKAHTKYDNFYLEPTFTGSDADREVYYVEL